MHNNLFKRSMNVINLFAKLISGTAFVGMILSIIVNVFSRYLFGKSFSWAEEIAYLLFNWSIYFGVTVLYNDQGLISIDAIVDRLPKKAQRIVSIGNYSLLLAINACLVVWGFSFAMRSWIRSSPSLSIPYFYFNVSVPLAAIILTIYSARFLIMTIRSEEIHTAPLEERA